MTVSPTARPAREALAELGLNLGIAAEHRGRVVGLAVGEHCHSAAPPSTFSRCINSDEE